LTTTVAPQALSLFNGELVQKQASHLADRLESEAGENLEKQLELGFQLTVCRRPTPTESATLLHFLKQGDRRLSLEQVCRVLFNLNEFVYPD
jgi:hypothetical protein